MASGTGKVRARANAFDDAEALAREAVSMAARSDFLTAHAEALMDLAEVLELASKPDESAAALEEAIRYYERKGNVSAAGPSTRWRLAESRRRGSRARTKRELRHRSTSSASVAG